MHVQRLALIGCGLMGGSFALALRQSAQVDHIAGYSASASSRQKALQKGAIDEACTSISDAVAGADVVVLAVPVAMTAPCLRDMADTLHPNALVMDVGSTKTDVVQAARDSLGAKVSGFVPAHPIAGKEVAGIEHADATLYRDRLVVLTPTDETNAAHVDRAQALWQAVGSRVEQLSPEVHDAAFAAVSHLPHLAAFALVNAVTQQPQGDLFLSMAGPGFRDFSRIAASDPVVWRDILLANRQEVLRQAGLMRDALHQFEVAMQSGDTQRLTELIESASRARGQWQLCGQ